MKFGSTEEVIFKSDDVEVISKTIYARGVPVGKFMIRKEQKLVGEGGNEIGDIMAYFTSLLNQYKDGQITKLGIETDKINPKTGKISRVTLMSEVKEY